MDENVDENKMDKLLNESWQQTVFLQKIE